MEDHDILVHLTGVELIDKLFLSSLTLLLPRNALQCVEEEGKKHQIGESNLSDAYQCYASQKYCHSIVYTFKEVL